MSPTSTASFVPASHPTPINLRHLQPRPATEASKTVAHIGLYREPETFVAVEYFFKSPSDLSERLAIVVSPVLATANTAVAAVDRLKERGARDIRLVCLLAAPEGVERFRGLHPDVPLWTAGVDEGLDEKAFIVPGLGDAGDRAYGTR